MAAELKREDIISDDALEAPLVLAKNLEQAYMVIQKIAKTGVQIPMPTDGFKKTREETEKLTAEQKELNKVAAQMATLNARNNELYLKEAEALKVAKQAMKEKTQLGERDAKTVTAQNSSVELLTAALQKNRLEYKKLATEEQRASKEGKELHKIIQQQDKDVKRLNASIGDHRDNVGNYGDALKDLKMQFKASKDELVGLASTLGTASPEFIEAAKRAGALKNEIGDIESSISSLSGSQLQNISGSLGLVGEKLKAADFKGASAAAKQFFTTMRGISFKEVTAGLTEFGATLSKETLKMMKNPWIALATVIAATGVAMAKLKDDSPGITKALDALGGPLGRVKQWFKDLTDSIGLTTFALDEVAESTVDASKKQIEAIQTSYDQQMRLTAAGGKDTLALEIEKNEAIKAEAVKGQKAIMDIVAEWGKFRSKEQEKDFFDLVNVYKEANTRIQELQTAHEYEMMLRREKAGYDLRALVIQESIKTQTAIMTNDERMALERIEASEKIEKERLALAAEQRDRALAEARRDENTTAGELLLISKEYEAAKTEITRQGVAERKAIEDGWRAEQIKRDEETFKEYFKMSQEAIKKESEQRTAALDEEQNKIKRAVIAGTITRQEGEAQLTALQKAQADDRVQIEIDAITKMLALYGFSTEEREKMAKELAALQNKLLDAQVKQTGETAKTQTELALEFIDKYKEAYGALMNSLANLSAAFTQRRLDEIEKEKEAAQEKTEQDLENEDRKTEQALKNALLTDEQREGIEANSEARKIAIEKAGQQRQEALDRKRRQAVRKQAMFEKAISASMAAINLAEGILAMFTAGPAGIALAAFTAAMGAVQLAIIAATPIPAAEHGIEDHKGGPIIAGEKGQELVKLPGGRLALTSAVATVYDLPRGTDIIPHDETMRMLATNSLHVDRAPLQGERYDRLEKKLDTINRTIKNKREWHLSGQVTGYQDGGTRAKYIESLRNRP